MKFKIGRAVKSFRHQTYQQYNQLYSSGISFLKYRNDYVTFSFLWRSRRANYCNLLCMYLTIQTAIKSGSGRFLYVEPQIY